MKALLLLISLFFVTTEAFGGLPPTTLRGQTQGTRTTTFNFEVPSNLVTKTTAGTLIELDGMNQLANPSFSASTFSSSWTKVDTSGSASISAQTAYKLPTTAQSYRLNMTSWVGTVCGSILTGAPWPKQSVASMWVAVSGAHNGKVCSRVDEVIQTCAPLTSDLSNETFIEYVIPTVTTGSTAEVCFVQDVASNDVVWLGKASLGAMPATMSPEVAQAQAAEVTFPGATNCTRTVTGTTSKTLYGVDADCPDGVRTGSGVVSTPATKIPAIVINPGYGEAYDIDVSGALINTFRSASTSTACIYSITDGTTHWPLQQAYVAGASATVAVGGKLAGRIRLSSPISTATTFTLAAQPTNSATNCAIENDNSAAYGDLKISVTAYPPASKIYSQACNDPRTCENVFSAKVSSTDVVTDENLDWINGNCTNATTGQATCVFNTGIFTVSPNCSCTPGAVGNGECHIVSQSSSQIVLQTENSAGTAINSDFTLICQKAPPDFKQQNQITGTFANVVTAPGISKPKTCYYAFGGASATLAAPTECTSGTCVEVVDTCGTGTPPTWATVSLYTALTFASGTWASNSFVKCDCVAYDVTTANVRKCETFFETSGNSWMTNSSGGYAANMNTSNTSGTANTSYVSLSCVGQAP